MPGNPYKFYTKAVFPASLDLLEEVRNLVRKVMKSEKLPFTDEEVLQILLAVDEAFTNAVKHAYQCDEEGKIQVIVKITSKKLIISVIDNGPGFRPKKINKREIIRRIKKFKRGGLGLYLIECIMDEVQFRINPGKKNEVKMIKLLAAGR